MHGLVDSTSRNFLHSILQKCHIERVYTYTTLFNVVVFMLFIGVFGMALYYCYKKKLTPEEQREKMMRDQAYIFSKIRYYQAERKKCQTITNLPWF